MTKLSNENNGCNMEWCPHTGQHKARDLTNLLSDVAPAGSENASSGSMGYEDCGPRFQGGEMTPIICDCDGVLLDWEGGFHRWLGTRGIFPDPIGPTSWNMDEWVGQPAIPLVEEFNSSEWFGRLRSTAYATMHLMDLSIAGHPIHVITSCSDDPTIIKLRYRNLLREFGDIFTSITCLPLGGSKSEALSKHDTGIWVEDNHGHGVTGHEMGLTTFMMRRPHNQVHEKGCTLTWVDDWRDIKSHLTGETHEKVSGVRGEPHAAGKSAGPAGRLRSAGGGEGSSRRARN